MLQSLRIGAKRWHSHCTLQAGPKTVLYGWGQTQALPLAKGEMDRVLNKPTKLKDLQDYALPKDSQVTHLATGWGHSLIGTADNELFSFGLNQSGQLGTNNHKINLESDETLKLVSCGREHSHFTTKDGRGTTKLYSFGNNMYGQLGIGRNKSASPGTLVAEAKPRYVEGLNEEIEHVVCGLDNTIFATESGSIYGIGWSADGQLGQGKDDKDVPTKLALSCPIQKLSSSTDFTLALTKDGRLWTWGNSEYGQGAQGKIIDRILEPLEINVDDVVDIAAGGPFSVLLTKDGNVYTCGYGALGLGKDIIQKLELSHVKLDKPIEKVYAATDYAVALAESGELFVWGLNGLSCRLGLGNNEHSFTPKRVDLDKKVIDVSLGTNHAMAICRD